MPRVNQQKVTRSTRLCFHPSCPDYLVWAGMAERKAMRTLGWKYVTPKKIRERIRVLWCRRESEDVHAEQVAEALNMSLSEYDKFMLTGEWAEPTRERVLDVLAALARLFDVRKSSLYTREIQPTMRAWRVDVAYPGLGFQHRIVRAASAGQAGAFVSRELEAQWGNPAGEMRATLYSAQVDDWGSPFLGVQCVTALEGDYPDAPFVGFM